MDHHVSGACHQHLPKLGIDLGPARAPAIGSEHCENGKCSEADQPEQHDGHDGGKTAALHRRPPSSSMRWLLIRIVPGSPVFSLTFNNRVDRSTANLNC